MIRNKIYAHNTSETIYLTQKKIKQFEDLLRGIAEICSNYSDDIYPNYYTKNVESLNKALKYYVSNL